jgi:ubiquinone/menaquinone biosynthesis C-methylase UbiE
MSFLTPSRIYEEEMLDAGEGTDDDVARSLGDLRRINRFLGGKRVILDAIADIVDRQSEVREISLLDVGTGSADIPSAVSDFLKSHHIKPRIAAVDLSERHIRLARSRFDVSSEVEFVRADSLALPFADKSFDFVTASLFLHHFRDQDVVRLLADFRRIAKRAVIINDLIRNRVPYYFTLITGPFLAASFLTRNDAPVSILRGFTRVEMSTLADRAGLDRRVIKRSFPYRLSMVADVRDRNGAAR